MKFSGLRRAAAIACVSIAATGVGGASVRPCTPPASGLVGWWSASEDAGDVTGVHDGAVFGPTIAIGDGEVGNGFHFYSQGDVVEIPNSPALEPKGITVEAWIYPTSSNWGQGFDNEYIVDNNTYGQPYGYVLDNYGGMRFLVANGSGADAVGGGNPPLNTWTHVAGTYDGFSLKMYIDGELVGQKGFAGGIAPTPNHEPVTIGANDRFGTSQFFGGIDEPAIYDRALTAGEIRAIYDAGASGKCRDSACAAPPAGLVAWYRGQNSPVDSQGAHDGALVFGGYAAGKVGRAFDLDGVAGHVQIPDDPLLYPGTGPLTVEAWIRSTGTTGDDQRIVTHYECGNDCIPNGGSDYELYVRQDGRAGAYLRDGSGASQEVIGTSTVQDSTFHHVAMVRDTMFGRFKLYVDGVAEGDDPLTVTGALANDDGEADDLEIGAIRPIHSQGRTGFFKGQIDEVSIYRRALSATELAQIHAAGSTGKCADCARLASAAPTAWYTGNSTADDRMGVLNAAAQGGVTYLPGTLSRAFALDGTTGTVQRTLDPTLKTPSITIDGWVWLETLGGYQTFVGMAPAYASVDGRGVYFDVDPNGIVRFSIGAGDNTYHAAIGSTNLKVHRWYHLAGSYDGERLRVFVDGSEDGTQAFSQPILWDDGAGYPSPAQLYIGAWRQSRAAATDTSADDFFLNGRIDDVRIWPRALTIAEIDAIYTAGSRGLCADAACSAGSVTFAKPAYAVNESSGGVTLALFRDTAVGAGDVQVDTANGTAIAPKDYAQVIAQIVHFADGQVRRTVTVPIANDAKHERREHFTIGISNPTANMCVGTDGLADVLIRDDD